MIQIENTPNPDSIKFLSEKTISVVGTEEFKKEKLNEITIPFVRELLSFKGVELIDKIKKKEVSHVNFTGLFFEKNLLNYK